MRVFLCFCMVLTLQLWHGVMATQVRSTLGAKRLGDARLLAFTCLVGRTDARVEMVHYEVRLAGWKGMWGRCGYLPVWVRPEPLANAGMRSQLPCDTRAACLDCRNRGLGWGQW